MKFGVGDGFRFGCGFFLAVLVAQIIVLIVFVVLSLAGVSVLRNINIPGLLEPTKGIPFP